MQAKPALYAGALAMLLSCIGCRHAEPKQQYAHLPPKYSDLPGIPTTTPAVPAKHGPNFNAVKLSTGLDPGWLRPPEELFTLGPGDRLEIELLGEPTSRALTSVAPDGKLYFNLLPGVDVWGLTLSQAKALLEQQL